MFEPVNYDGNLQKKYDMLYKQLDALLEDEDDPTANLANAAALLQQFLDRTNWVGFYLLKEGELVLGPFQGLPACVRIQVGKGVCGTAAKIRETQVVEDVHQFPGHIACDAASQSEVVVPIIINDQVYGVLDIDSPEKARFSEEEGRLLTVFVEHLVPHLQR
ncbi:free methionine-(R)-sulfoxide reductase [Geomicrobium sp. JCM 19037]|uniref:GAF domain-containing protein n=1 Tax=unclassified Geomicrobium TaxID=2628951 RepID=UPI00045F1B6F|nr:GAF domain-containing protein [Geomicrobium sp. JCM 19037]GAK02900.1 free methionine-(R)-sulfoxide reductase [Geomicrobium sp. JCM 19037]